MQCGRDRNCRIKRATRAVAILCIALMAGSASAAWGAEAGAAAPAPLTTLRAIRALSHAEAVKEPPVDFEATVVFTALDYGTEREEFSPLFVQEDGQGIFVDHVYHARKLLPGDRLLIVMR